MPSMANIVLTDTNPSPDVDYTFVPQGISGNVATFVAPSADGVPIGARRLTASVSTSQSGRNTVAVKLSIPVVQDVTVGGVTKPEVIRTLYWSLQCTSDSTANTDERYGSFTMIKDLLTEQSIQDMFSLLTPYF
jgi:hypothetical protein